MKAWKFAALPVLLWSAGVSAQATDSDQGEVGVSGTVAPICILGAPSRATVDLGQMATLSGARVGRIAVLPAQVVTLPNSFCNFAGSTVTVSATALLSNNSGSVPAGFSRAVNYTAAASNWAASATSATTAATASGAGATATGAGAVQPDPRLADISVALSGFTAPSDALLVSGSYSGLIVITLGPAATAK